MKKVLVYGSLEFGKVVKDLVTQCDQEFDGFIDDCNVGEGILGTFAQVSKNYPQEQYCIAIAVGYKNLEAREKIAHKVQAAGFELATLIHPRAYVRDLAQIGPGALVMAGAIVDVNARIGSLVVLWPGVVVNHDSEIGPNTFISPNATVCGSATIGNNCFIGAGATIVDHTQVAPCSFIKAGALYYTHR